MPSLRLLFLIVSASAILLLPSKQAGATGGMSTLGEAELEKAFAELVLGPVSLATEDIEISHFSATPDLIELPPGEMSFRIISQTPNRQLGQKTIVADILVDEVVQKRVTLSGELARYGNVACLTKTLAQHSIITASDLTLVRRNLSLLGPGLITDLEAAIGKETKMTLPAGAILYGTKLKEPAIIKRGDIVSIQAASESISITVPGRVLNGGAKGDLIKVKNLMSRKEVFVKIIGSDTVQAQF